MGGSSFFWIFAFFKLYKAPYDFPAEPFLRPKLSDRLLDESPISSNVEEILVSQSLCAANVAMVTIKRPPASGKEMNALFVDFFLSLVVVICE